MNSHSTTDELYPQNPPLSTTSFQFFFFFFWIDIKKKLLLKGKKPTQVQWKCTIGARIKNPDYKIN